MVRRIFYSRFYEYIGKYGTEIGERECFFNHDVKCDMKCPHAVITDTDNDIIPNSMPNSITKKYEKFQVLCTKFSPAACMTERSFFENEKGGS